MRTLGLLLVLFLLAPLCALADPAISPESISKKIQTLGGRATLAAIYINYVRWSRVLAGIATGTKDWLSIAVQLHDASDAEASEQIALAVGEALEHQPENVLSLAVPKFGVQYVCSSPDVDNPRFDSYDLSMAAIARRQEKVRLVHNNELVQVRDACEFALEGEKIQIGRFYGHAPQRPLRRKQLVGFGSSYAFSRSRVECRLSVGADIEPRRRAVRSAGHLLDIRVPISNNRPTGAAQFRGMALR